MYVFAVYRFSAFFYILCLFFKSTLSCDVCKNFEMNTKEWINIGVVVFRLYCWLWMTNSTFSAGLFSVSFYHCPHTCMIFNKLTQLPHLGFDKFYFDSFLMNDSFQFTHFLATTTISIVHYFFIFIVQSFIILILVCIPFFGWLFLIDIVAVGSNSMKERVLHKRVKYALFVSIAFCVFNSIVV